MPAVHSTALWRTQNATSGGCCKAEQNLIGAVTQRTHLVEFLGYFLPDKPSSVSESNPNSEDESEDKNVVKKGRKYCFPKEWLREFEWLRSQRNDFHELQILQSIPATCGEHEICR